MILVTGASGQVGQMVVERLASNGLSVKAFVHKNADIVKMKDLGANEVFVGDLRKREDVLNAFDDVDAVYHIPPAAYNYEVEIGELVIMAAKRHDAYLVYHSVLHSLLFEMPHHQKKNEVERTIIESGIDFTIVQPAIFTQMLIPWINNLKDSNEFRQKFYTNSDTRICFLDLNDLADAVVEIINSQKYVGGTYELCGPENLNLADITSILENHFKKTIKIVNIEDQEFTDQLKLEGYKKDTLLKMFEHYNRNGFIGNSKTLEMIINRKPKSLVEFLEDL